MQSIGKVWEIWIAEKFSVCVSLDYHLRMLCAYPYN